MLNQIRNGFFGTLLASLLCICGMAGAAMWETVDYPGAEFTKVFGGDGDHLVGQFYHARQGYMGFTYDGTNWNTFDIPGLLVHNADIWNDTIVVTIDENAFVNEKTFSVPGASWTSVTGINEGRLVGSYRDALGIHGFVYENQLFSSFSIPFSVDTWISGTDGDVIVGAYDKHDGLRHGFVYRDQKWRTLDFPGARQTFLYGADNNIVTGVFSGNFYTSGFYHDGINFVKLDFNNAECIVPYDVQGDQIIGSYYENGKWHGFTYTVPEPTGMLLLGVGTLILHRRFLQNL